jgi:hypothetical protein
MEDRGVQSVKDTHSALLRCLTLLALVPTVVTLLTELNKGIVIWRFRIVDMADLVILAPFYFIALVWLRGIFFQRDRSTSFSHLSLGFIALFIYGHAVHLTANAINTYMTEVHNYQDLIPLDTYQLIYFLDEKLGHVLLFVGLFGLFLVCAHSESKSVFSVLQKREIAWLSAVGLLQGIAIGIALIEASLSILAYVFPVAYAVFTSTIFSQYEQRLPGYFARRPFALYLCAFCLNLILIPTAYILLLGRFVEPSTLYPWR